MIPLLFLNPRWVRENPLAAFLIGVVFLGVGMAFADWLRRWRGI